MIFIICRYCILFIGIMMVICHSISSQFIRPITSNLKIDNRETMSLKEAISVFNMINSRSVIKIDLNRPFRQQAIVLRNSAFVKLNLFCSINIPLSTKKEDVYTQFCFQTSLSQDPLCSDLRSLKNELILFNMRISAFRILKGNGYSIILDSSQSPDNDLSGYYYCKSNTVSSGVVLSNVVEIRDIIYWGKNLITSPPQSVREKYLQNLEISKMPKSFECVNQVKSHLVKDMPHWIELEFKSIARWAWCPVAKQRPNLMELEKTYIEDCLSQSISKCENPHHLCPYKRSEMPGWISFLAFDGTVTFIKGQKFNDYGNTLDGYALMCYYKSKDTYKVLRYIANDYGTTQFFKGLQFLNKENNRTSIEVIETTKKTIGVGILKEGFIITAFYYTPSNITYEWRRNGNILYNSSEWIVTPYSLQYKRKINFEIEGEYNLNVKFGQRYVTFSFDVIVLSPPFLTSTSIPTICSSIYAMVGSNISVSYRYQARPTNVLVYINGLVYKPGESDRKVFMNDLTKKSFYLKDLVFNVALKNLPKNIVELTYNVTNVSYSNMVRLAQDHSLIMEAKNTYGISRSHLNIYVLNSPVYVNLPVNDNCTIPCSSLQPHLFHCEINNEYYINREVVVEKFWMVNGMRLDSLPYYSKFFKEDSKGLHMSAINSTKSENEIALKLLFKKATLICRIRLLYPGSLGMSEDNLFRDKRIIFDTINDPYFVSNSAAIITLDWEPTIVTASYTWVVFLIIALLLIMMFVFLLVRLTLRDQGQSYQIEKLEIAKGINREEEIIENEIIRPYVRSAQSIGCQIDLVPVVTVHYRLDKSRAPVLCSNCRTFEYGNNFGNGNISMTNKSFLSGYKPHDTLDIIDDEDELEDASKFNEEGSFIGVYASKDKLSNLPGEVKLKTDA